MQSQKQPDWRGSSTRFRSSSQIVSESMNTLLQNQLQNRPTHMCETLSPAGSVECRFLTSALSHWRTFIGALTSSESGEKRVRSSGESGGGPATRQAVSLGTAVGIILIATCQECKRRNVLSTTLSIEQLSALSLKNSVPSQPGAIFISWRLEIGNTFRAGKWGMSEL